MKLKALENTTRRHHRRDGESTDSVMLHKAQLYSRKMVFFVGYELSPHASSPLFPPLGERKRKGARRWRRQDVHSWKGGGCRLGSTVQHRAEEEDVGSVFFFFFFFYFFIVAPKSSCSVSGHLWPEAVEFFNTSQCDPCSDSLQHVACYMSLHRWCTEICFQNVDEKHCIDDALRWETNQRAKAQISLIIVYLIKCIMEI